MYGYPKSYSDWAAHFERKREKKKQFRRRVAVVAFWLMATAGMTAVGAVSCAPAIA